MVLTRHVSAHRLRLPTHDLERKGAPARTGHSASGTAVISIAAAGAGVQTTISSIRIFLEGWPLSGAWRWRPIATRANGQPAVAYYAWDEDEHAYLTDFGLTGELEKGAFRDIAAERHHQNRKQRQVHLG